MISPTEMAEVLRARARELAAGVEMTTQQRNHLEVQIQAGARAVWQVATAIEAGWQPVAVAMVETVVALSRQLASPAAELPVDEPAQPRPSGAGPAHPPAGAGAYRNRGGRR